MLRRILFLLCFIIPASVYSQVSNQNLYDTMPTMVDHYRKRLAEFKKQPVVKDKVIFLGNSITEGGEGKLTDNTNQINRGIGGDVTFGVLARIDEVIKRQPSKLFILIGINDIAKDFPIPVIMDNYKKIIARVKSGSPRTKIYVQSLLPLNARYPRFPQHYDKSDQVIRVNTLLRDLATTEGVGFINLYPLFMDDQQALRASYTYDGLHLNAEGYKIWLEYLKENKYL